MLKAAFQEYLYWLLAANLTANWEKSSWKMVFWKSGQTGGAAGSALAATWGGLRGWWGCLGLLRMVRSPMVCGAWGAAPSEILVSREFSREFFNFHFSFSISSHLSFTFNSRKRVKGIYFSLFTSRKKWKLSEFHSFFSRKKSEIRCGVWPDISLSSQIVFFLKSSSICFASFLEYINGSLWNK